MRYNFSNLLTQWSIIDPYIRKPTMPNFTKVCTYKLWGEMSIVRLNSGTKTNQYPPKPSPTKGDVWNFSSWALHTDIRQYPVPSVPGLIISPPLSPRYSKTLSPTAVINIYIVKHINNMGIEYLKILMKLYSLKYANTIIIAINVIQTERWLSTKTKNNEEMMSKAVKKPPLNTLYFMASIHAVTP